MSAPTQSPDSQQLIAELRATRPYDGRRVTLQEKRGGWQWTGIRGVCLHIAADYRLMVLVVEHDYEDRWPVGAEILVELDEESFPVFGDHEGN